MSATDRRIFAFVTLATLALIAFVVTTEIGFVGPAPGRKLENRRVSVNSRHDSVAIHRTKVFTAKASSRLEVDAAQEIHQINAGSLAHLERRATGQEGGLEKLPLTSAAIQQSLISVDRAEHQLRMIESSDFRRSQAHDRESSLKL
jgi:hypothetical protein